MQLCSAELYLTTKKMASIAIMLGGAVLNATTFIGRSYLAKYLSGGNTDRERVRHDKAIEKYQKDYSKYEENRQRVLGWIDANRHNDDDTTHLRILVT